MAERTVHCVKLEKTAPGLEKPPFPGELGQQIFEQVSQEAWNQWQGDLMIKVINEYRLDLSNNDHYNTLLEQMRAFLNLSQGTTLEVGNATRGRSGLSET